METQQPRFANQIREGRHLITGRRASSSYAFGLNQLEQRKGDKAALGTTADSCMRLSPAPPTSLSRPGHRRGIIVSVSTSAAVGFAEEWIAKWNARDVEAVLKHFHQDVMFTSTTAARVVPETDGVIVGKAALRDYWTRALAVNSDLHFELDAVYEGVSALSIQYKNQGGHALSEVYEFDENGLIVHGYALRRTAS